MTTNQSSNLRPCPFCGAMPIGHDDRYMCSTPGCVMQEDTISAENWNTRPIEDALNARIAELEELVDELVDSGDNLFDSLNPIAWKHEWIDKWWKLSNRIRKEREE